MRKNLLLISALSFSFLIQAQVKTTVPAKVAPSRIKVYTPSGESSSSEKSSKDNSYKWAIKTDVFGIISGEFPLIAEYRFAPKFSAEVSAGVTYAYLPNDFSIDGGDTNTKAAMGTAFRGAVKFYPSSDYDAIEGWNFGIQVFSKTTNREYDTSVSEGYLLNGLKDTKSKTGISLIIGKQIFEDSNVTFESYFGIGFASIKTETSKIESTYDSVTGDNIYSVATTLLTETKPNFQLGFRIGFGN
ncbi:hypothetical protein [Flavobacterium sp.]|uniref:hypothetical protein n=1 Tax=Flavobacterium sp. TaxID=239 RepID=UPI003BDB31D5